MSREYARQRSASTATTTIVPLRSPRRPRRAGSLQVDLRVLPPPPPPNNRSDFTALATRAAPMDSDRVKRRKIANLRSHARRPCFADNSAPSPNTSSHSTRQQQASKLAPAPPRAHSATGTEDDAMGGLREALRDVGVRDMHSTINTVPEADVVVPSHLQLNGHAGPAPAPSKKAPPPRQQSSLRPGGGMPRNDSSSSYDAADDLISAYTQPSPAPSPVKTRGNKAPSPMQPPFSSASAAAPPPPQKERQQQTTATATTDKDKEKEKERATTRRDFDIIDQLDVTGLYGGGGASGHAVHLRRVAADIARGLISHRIRAA